MGPWDTEYISEKKLVYKGGGASKGQKSVRFDRIDRNAQNRNEARSWCSTLVETPNLLVFHHGAAGPAFSEAIPLEGKCRDIDILKDLVGEDGPTYTAVKNLAQMSSMNTLRVLQQVRKLTGMNNACSLSVLYVHARLFNGDELDMEQNQTKKHSADFDAEMTLDVAVTAAKCIFSHGVEFHPNGKFSLV